MAPSRKLHLKTTCTVCRHPERHRIEMLRLAGTSGDVLAERFGISRDSVYRHMRDHVDAETKAMMVADVPLAELAERAAKEGVSLLDYFSIIRTTCMDALLRAAAINDHNGTAALAKRAVEVNREIGRLSGEMLNSAPVSTFTQNNIFMTSPIMARLEGMLVERLSPFPEALGAVLAGLRDLDGHAAASASPPLLEAPRAA